MFSEFGHRKAREDWCPSGLEVEGAGSAMYLWVWARFGLGRHGTSPRHGVLCGSRPGARRSYGRPRRGGVVCERTGPPVNTVLAVYVQRCVIPGLTIERVYVNTRVRRWWGCGSVDGARPVTCMRGDGLQIGRSTSGTLGAPPHPGHTDTAVEHMFAYGQAGIKRCKRRVRHNARDSRVGRVARYVNTLSRVVCGRARRRWGWWSWAA